MIRKIGQQEWSWDIYSHMICNQRKVAYAGTQLGFYPNQAAILAHGLVWHISRVTLLCTSPVFWNNSYVDSKVYYYVDSKFSQDDNKDLASQISTYEILCILNKYVL